MHAPTPEYPMPSWTYSFLKRLQHRVFDHQWEHTFNKILTANMVLILLESIDVDKVVLDFAHPSTLAAETETPDGRTTEKQSKPAETRPVVDAPSVWTTPSRVDERAAGPTAQLTTTAPTPRSSPVRSRS